MQHTVLRLLFRNNASDSFRMTPFIPKGCEVLAGKTVPPFIPPANRSDFLRLQGAGVRVLLERNRKKNRRALREFSFCFPDKAAGGYKKTSTDYLYSYEPCRSRSTMPPNRLIAWSLQSATHSRHRYQRTIDGHVVRTQWASRTV